ncbi:HEAT repeat domain-containing protein [Enhygromyxa salina]|uniref:Uncharacterized protein n=1 Tax=Enhygromyxa salina TaxID=215803 RepID=A0A2S9Y0C9_9BACT|nr:HEAT repeat domain-containing protein [Enhygromyxa salina]PRP98564.1 hypothetical protein ENSA7_65070 [Enhygromyxa salina]
MSPHDKKYEFDGFKWEGNGYFGCRRPPAGATFPQNPRKQPWYALAVALEQAKHGNLTNVPRLLEVADKEIDGVLDHACAQILGDAGPTACYPELIEVMRLNENYEFTFSICDALSKRGRLGDIPLLLDAFEANQENGDAEIIPIDIADMLDPGDYSIPIAPDECGGMTRYREVIERTWRDLAERLGSEDALVLRGGLLDVRSLAKLMHHYAKKPVYFPIDLRRKFEAMTGIDCTAFYENRGFCPLPAMAIVEDFLDSPQVENFQPGVRYFFGHRVP